MSRLGDTELRRWALAVFALITALAVINPALGQGVAGRPGISASTVVDYGDSVFCLLMGTSGLLVLWFRPRHSVGWLLLFVGLVENACVFGQTYGARAVAYPREHLPGGTLVLELSAPLWLVAVFVPATCMLLRYPSGRIAGRWARRVDRAAICGLTLLYLGYATSPNSVTDTAPGLRPPLPLPAILGGVLMGAGAIAVLGAAAFTLVDTVRRTLRATYPERQQLAWIVTVTPIAVGGLFVPVPYFQRLLYAVPLAVVVGVLRYRLAGIEVVVRRTLVYGSLTGFVLVVFVAVTAGLSSVFPRGGAPQVLAAVVVAVGVVPLRDRLQRTVDRFVYGDRSDPLLALRRLSSPFGATTGERLLPEVLSGVAAAVRVPGAEIVGSGGTRAVVGFVEEATVEVPLVMGGSGVGVLRLAPRPGEAHLPVADRRLVEDLAPLVAAVLHSVELAEALRIEQERVVAATATERARLRQDLHDGLGPSLTGIGLGLEALEARVGASDLVERLRSETAASLDEVRRIIDGLRPGVLESADLLGLLRVRAQHLSATTPVRVTVEAPDRLPVLPDDVETAALRVVEEALTNVVRHAAATSCTVTVALEGDLQVEVRDNGRGYDGPRIGGVGIGSMQSRARALGGSCDVVGTAEGTLVSLLLPLGVRQVAS